MAQFYKELKELRESQGILLDEISDRTKINIRYLTAIEAGEFSVIDTPYLRLFLRAYAEEIGGDSERTLSQLDSFLGTTQPTIKTIKPTPEKPPISSFSDKVSDAYNQSDQKLRQDLLKGSMLLLVFIFVIVIFQKIFNEDNSATIQQGKVETKIKNNVISESELLQNFIEDQSTTLSLNDVKPPFFIKLRTREEISYSFKTNQTEPTEGILQGNFEYDLDAFVEASDLLFNNTLGLSTFINGKEIHDISDYPHPLRLTIKPNPATMVIQRFKPIQ